MDGIIVINKPKDYTSRDVVNVISKKLNTKKIGHTGTLDPLATGVLVLCINKGLKLVELLTSNDKEYIAKIKLGIETDTLDITGNIINKKDMNISKEETINVLNSFKGKSKQQVPKYSAIKIKGKKLYEYARQNIEIELPFREIEVFDIELISDIKDNEFTIKVSVSKGTYIRSLIRDIGYKLNGYATMLELERTKQGKFSLNDSYTLKDIENDNYKVIPIQEVLSNIKQIKVKDKLLFQIKNGVILNKDYQDNLILFKDINNNPIALYKKDNDKYRCYKMF